MNAERYRGQIFTMVLAFIAFGGVVSTAILSLTSTSLRVSDALQSQRNEQYAAAAAVDTQIEYLRSDPDLGNGTNPCPDLAVSFNDVAVAVSCTNTGTTTIGRDLVVVAEVDGAPVVTASVFIDAGSDPEVFINAWTYGTFVQSTG